MKKLIFLIILILLVLTLVISQENILSKTPNHYKINKTLKSNIQKNILNKTSINKTLKEKPIILVHDVSPKYFTDLKEVVKIINKYNYSNNTILFVIPDLDGKWDLRKYKNFVEYLHKLEKRGYKIGLHGYEHTFHEFNCPKDICLEKLHNAELIMKDCGFNNITLFLPPAWVLSNESLKVLLANNFTIILTNKIIYPNGSSKKIINKEYTWYLKKKYVNEYLIKAENDYHYASKHKIPFYLSIHMGVVNYGGGLEFLDRFLNETEHYIRN